MMMIKMSVLINVLAQNASCKDSTDKKMNGIIKRYKINASDNEK